ncbi:MAG: TolC family protein [Taibaiella sp.]|nr:TolC family protein [Taibaiella sp.]
MRYTFFIFLVYIFSGIQAGFSQERTVVGSAIANDTANTGGMSRFTLRQCIAYAVRYQPALRQAGVDERIAKANKAIAVSSWLPQVNASANYQHYLQLPTTFFPVNGTLTPIQTGVINTSSPQVAVTQSIFSNETLLANRTASLYIQASKENTNAALINLVVAVSKAFYDVLLSAERAGVYREDTARLRKNQSDAYHRFVSGIADKVDYKQATIALNNSMSQLKTATEDVAAKTATLKLLMGSPQEHNFTVSYGTAQMMRDIVADTLGPLRVERRVEYRQLQLVRRIQRQSTRYYKLGFLPTLSAFYTYNYPFLNNNYADLYSKGYPNSFYGLSFNIPIFTGFRRTANVRKAELQEERMDWDEVNLELTIYAEYKKALAAYKSNYYYLATQAENAALAREVYNVVKLQYAEGVKAYLDVIIAEADLQTSEINYQNSLFQTLQSKTDLDKAIGNVDIDE